MKTLPPIFDDREFADVDRHFALWVAGFGSPDLSALAAACLSRNIRAGHICLDLAAGPGFEETPAGFAWPSLAEWRAALKKNRATGAPEDARPLVLDDAGRLYMRRYWLYEKSLAEDILRRCENCPVETMDDPVEAAFVSPFLVISGGPGTGKTTTVLKIIEHMLARPGHERLRIALAAPTGKAAARLEESLRVGGATHPAHMPKTASTIHRLLGSIPGSAFFRHNANNPLPLDLVVVDEASMVPLPLMAKLFEALPPAARVILLGDQHQLASVEPGFVLGDIAAAASAPGSPLRGSLVELKKNHRFSPDSAIFALSSAVREGNADAAFEVIAHPQTDLAASPLPAPQRLMETLRAPVMDGYGAAMSGRDPAAALQKFRQFRILCALRSGPYGVDNLNRKIEAILRAEGLLTGGAGMPLLITRNDHELRLYNGDTGILLPDETGAMQAWFTDQDGTLRRIAPSRLPQNEPAFAMTVHKSQGSEYDRALLVLPARESAVFTRELVYTGLTRARTRVELWYREESLCAAIAQPVRRGSGLRERLAGA